MSHTRRTEVIAVRVKPQEKETIRRKAAEVGLSVSDYLRHLALTYQVPETEKTKEDIQ